MKQLLTAFSIFITALAGGQEVAFSAGAPAGGPAASRASFASHFSSADFQHLQTEGKAVRKVLGFSKNNALIEYYYFPGRSNQRALVIGGVHGSELSAIEVAYDLVRQLQEGEKPYYSVVVVPRLFPDNADAAEECTCDRHETNRGRYSFDGATDPNRQLPKLGTAFNPQQPVDAYGRPIEVENALLLQLIQSFAPSRIANLHAIKNYDRAGVYADPRTDCKNKALGYSSDSLLALKMATYIAGYGGNVPGNKLRTAPTAVYYLDPKPTPAGCTQQRNLSGMNAAGKISGVSLGSWASTAVCDATTGYSRPAMRILTVEFPGYLRPTEYALPLEQEWYKQQVLTYAGALLNCFLGDCVVDGDPTEGEWAVR